MHTKSELASSTISCELYSEHIIALACKKSKTKELECC